MPFICVYLSYDPVKQIPVLMRENTSLDGGLCLKTVRKLLGVLQNLYQVKFHKQKEVRQITQGQQNCSLKLQFFSSKFIF